MNEETDSQKPDGGPTPAPSSSGLVPHTPAPWRAQKGHEDDPERWMVVADHPKTPWHIATIENGQPGDCCATEGSTARLIAAAPELLVSLRDLLLAYECADETGYIEGEGFLDVDAIREKSRAAIAKALGQNPEFSGGNPSAAT